MMKLCEEKKKFLAEYEKKSLGFATSTSEQTLKRNVFGRGFFSLFFLSSIVYQTTSVSCVCTVTYSYK